MQVELSREQVAAIAVIKWVRQLVGSYKGRPESLKAWLLSQLEEESRRADEILASAYEAVL